VWSHRPDQQMNLFAHEWMNELIPAGRRPSPAEGKAG
jgi:hypothetical protein